MGSDSRRFVALADGLAIERRVEGGVVLGGGGGLFLKCVLSTEDETSRPNFGDFTSFGIHGAQFVEIVVLRMLIERVVRSLAVHLVGETAGCATNGGRRERTHEFFDLNVADCADTMCCHV